MLDVSRPRREWHVEERFRMSMGPLRALKMARWISEGRERMQTDMFVVVSARVGLL